MTFWLKKLVSLFFTPLTACLVLIGVGLALTYFPRFARWGRRLAVAALLFLAVLSNHFVARVLIQPLESRHPAVPDIPRGATLPASLQACKFIVVLGGGYGWSEGRAAIGELTLSANARVTEAVRLYRLLPEAVLILCGPDLGGGITHANQLRRAAVSLGVPPERILVLEQARDTETEALDVRQIVGNQPVALVTSASHMRRAAALFRGAGMNALPCPTGYLTQENETLVLNQYLVDASSLRDSSTAIHEHLGLLWSRLRGKSKE